MKFFLLGENESGASIYESDVVGAGYERVYVVFAPGSGPATESMREFVYLGMSPSSAVYWYGTVSGFNMDRDDVEEAVNKELRRRTTGVIGDFYVEPEDSGFYAYEFFE